MPLTPPERISLIRDCVTLLDKYPWDEIDLILDQFDFPTYEADEDESRADYVRRMIRKDDDAKLSSLHTYLTEQADGSRPGRTPWSGNKLRLFFSHAAQYAGLVEHVSTSLGEYGVEPFIAHNSIQPSGEWQDVIEAALAECDAMVVFLHTEFASSQWCAQEVGWALGRRRPVLPLNYGLNPYGFLAKYQSQPCQSAAPYKVAGYIMDWLIKTPSLHNRLAPSLVDAFVNSRRWDFTRTLVPLLDRLQSVSDDDLGRMEKAAVDNVDVRECVITSAGNISGPEWVQRYVAKRRGTTEAPIWISDEPPF